MYLFTKRQALGILPFDEYYLNLPASVFIRSFTECALWMKSMWSLNEVNVQMLLLKSICNYRAMCPADVKNAPIR